MRRPGLTARRTALAAGAALLAAGLWWVVRAPAVGGRAAAAPPAVDIDPPAMRARREAALALAMMPDDPWTFAESLAASAPPAAGPAREDCGIEGRPALLEPNVPGQAPVQGAGASSRYAAAQARVDAALRSSADPLDRAVADWLNVGGMRTQAGRDEAVVQQAATTTDARLYAFGYGLCHAGRSAAAGCLAISLERWIQLDADNGIPWVTVLADARSRGDPEAVRDAMSHLASAARFDTYAAAIAGVVPRRATEADDVAAVNDLSFSIVAESSMLIPAYQPLIELCRDKAGDDAELARRCQAISDVMFAHSDNLISQAMSGALLLQATGEGSRRDFIRAERALAATHWSPATGFSRCGEMRESLRRLVRMSQVGEVEAMRERARQFAVP